jgi:hypothetical protein
MLIVPQVILLYYRFNEGIENALGAWENACSLEGSVKIIIEVTNGENRFRIDGGTH